MTLDGLLALVAAVVAVYAIPRPSTRESIKLFAPLWLLLSSLLLPAIAIIAADCVDKLSPWQLLPSARFILEKAAFLLPVGVFCFAGYRWWCAKLKKRHEQKFMDFIAICQRDGDFAELVRIVEKNCDQLPSLFRPETLYRLFDPRFVSIMVKARCWVHLDLLGQKDVQSAMPRFSWALKVVLKELLTAETSPLRSEFITPLGRPVESDEEKLLDKTFMNPEWYISDGEIKFDGILDGFCTEVLRSGRYDEDYNRSDSLYSSYYGGATSMSCPLFMSVKMYLRAVDLGVEANIHLCTTCLVQIFQEIAKRSRYSVGVWESNREIVDHPTPFSVLLETVVTDLEEVAANARPDPDEPDSAPRGDAWKDVIRAWADCVFWLVAQWDGDEESDSTELVKPEFARGFVENYLRFIIESWCVSQHAKKGEDPWVNVPIEKLTEAVSLHGRRAKNEGMDVLNRIRDENYSKLGDELYDLIRPKLEVAPA